MTRVAIYARFSSDLQNEKSCRDQIDLCSTYAEAHGFAIVGTFQDDAVSGASTINRPAMLNLLRSAQDRKFDTVLCETLDRLSRDQADLLQIRKELAFHDITIHSVQDGLADTLHIGIKGLMGELYLVDLAQKTKRGLRAVIKDGRQAGGRSYGYSLVIGKAGEQTINEREAKVVLRIFTEYAAHRTPRQIAAGLNQDGIPGHAAANGTLQPSTVVAVAKVVSCKTVFTPDRLSGIASVLSKTQQRANAYQESIQRASG